ncbi:hypothetical protein P152DRAFT_405785 [Eremomyces bilateralis CBS 781.70]|uniref:SPRY domain-containing protein n=1 Tax=Eremomyces bilateralis CBS 781.70 TaxID=1392243 RepID=A0A6G1FR91_9PEZI|nr:uncharacterized protein P152DRAFT_405785 [Eremomyces bilateralis CBS 781.70]KAF1808293.1 hypothetical protein P152DRAFT_405785 [Eremomyces bilateralis CBS 781.70]
MAEGTSLSRSHTPSAIPPQRRPEDDHTPAVSSPLNPDGSSRQRATRPSQREQREKKESLKKRESATATRGNTPDLKSKSPQESVPIRYNYLNPKPSDFEPPRETWFASVEPTPVFTPDGRVELLRPMDHAQNVRGFRYQHCIADPLFHHKHFFRTTDTVPYGPRINFEDSDKWLRFDRSGTYITNDKGWRSCRANVCAREGRYYYEVKIIKGIPAEDAALPKGTTGPQPHIRVGFSRREASLDCPVGFDGYSYGIRDVGMDTMHRSRAGRISNLDPKSKAKSKTAKQTQTSATPLESSDLSGGDVLGVEISLPSLRLHRAVVSNEYNPAVDVDDGFGDSGSNPHDTPSFPLEHNILRDRIPISFRGTTYFETHDYQPTKPMEAYASRSPSDTLSQLPNPAHDEPSLRTLPSSYIRIFKNGQLMGTGWENLMAFLPPASAPADRALGMQLRAVDDGAAGYYPSISVFSGGIAQVNFGPDFWYPPPELVPDNDDADRMEVDEAPQSAGGVSGSSPSTTNPTTLKGFNVRYKEQIAEDLMWDLIDEATFFVMDGGFDYEQNGLSRGSGPAVGMRMLDD